MLAPSRAPPKIALPESGVKLLAKLSTTNETSWMQIGVLWELMQENDKATMAFENVLRLNPHNVQALTQLASICTIQERYQQAIDYFQKALLIDKKNGEIWGALGHCLLMTEDLQKAYAAYQQALFHLNDPKDPNLWYGIGILYERYGSLEHAEEAFNAVLKMNPNFEKKNETYFRLGVIYKQQMKLDKALDCFQLILREPPAPLAQSDILFQIGHVYEIKQCFSLSKDAYERILKENPNHPKALQQLGWLYHHHNEPSLGLGNQDVAMKYLKLSIKADASDDQTWYILGRTYMAQKKYRRAYDAYQQAVLRDQQNPTFWCSIGVLYYQINQYRDSLDAYTRAIQLNPHLPEVWYDLGTLYESCNQLQDSLDAYQKAIELDPENQHILHRLTLVKQALEGNTSVNADKPIATEPDNKAHQHQHQQQQQASKQHPPPYQNQQQLPQPKPLQANQANPPTTSQTKTSLPPLQAAIDAKATTLRPIEKQLQELQPEALEEKNEEVKPGTPEGAREVMEALESQPEATEKQEQLTEQPAEKEEVQVMQTEATPMPGTD